MKRTKSMIYKETVESNELFLCAVNDGRIYRTMVIPVVRNLAKKYIKGTFDKDKAIDAFYPIATQEAKLYCKQYARLEDYVSVFSVTDRFTCAVDMLNYYMENIEKNDL